MESKQGKMYQIKYMIIIIKIHTVKNTRVEVTALG